GRRYSCPCPRFAIRARGRPARSTRGAPERRKRRGFAARSRSSRRPRAVRPGSGAGRLTSPSAARLTSWPPTAAPGVAAPPPRMERDLRDGFPDRAGARSPHRSPAPALARKNRDRSVSVTESAGPAHAEARAEREEVGVKKLRGLLMVVPFLAVGTATTVRA